MNQKIVDRFVFVRSGDVYVGNGFLRDVGINGRCWSRNGATASNAYHLGFGISGAASSSGPNNRYFGFSLRCLQE